MPHTLSPAPAHFALGRVPYPALKIYAVGMIIGGIVAVHMSRLLARPAGVTA
ncbi:hypothetical protein ACH4D5_27975 [Streptomyces sp. NPDC018029]|uniref:hypothetical protein n=1 Tax=Streptomyces sp. NPDC018029 TaxID=3365032 RepID=UPI0037BB5D7D